MSTFCNLTVLLLALASALAARSAAGAPGCSGSGLEFADREFFVLCHSSAHRLPLWVGYELKPSQLARVAARPSRFRPDRQRAGPSSDNLDYRGSGYSRGHLAPAADFAWSQAAIHATFLLSNVIPQRQSVNQGRWSQLEAAVRRLAAASDVLYVFTGPVISSDPERIGPGQVAVPTHTFKVILAVQASRNILYAAIVPNETAVTEPRDLCYQRRSRRVDIGIRLLQRS